MTKNFNGNNWRDNPEEQTDMVFGSGNFLADRGYADPEEARLKFYLANQIALLVEAQSLRQTEICALTGLSQPDVSKIVNGNVSGYSVWKLLRTLKGLGGRITVSVENPAQRGGIPAEMSI